MSSTTAKPSIYISYRRADDLTDVKKLKDHLDAYFHKSLVFYDTEDASRADALKSCDLMLVLIGKQWLGANSDEHLPLPSKLDPIVRNEIVAALERRIPLFPLLVNHVVIPDSDVLPHDVQRLFTYHISTLSRTRFPQDVQYLVKSIRVHLRQSEAFESKSKDLAAAVEKKLSTQYVLSGCFEINWARQKTYQPQGRSIFVAAHPDSTEKHAIRILQQSGWKFAPILAHTVATRVKNRIPLQREWRIRNTEDVLNVARDVVMANYSAFGIHPHEMKFEYMAIQDGNKLPLPEGLPR